MQMRDLKLLRETLSSDEVAAALAARANMVIRARGIALEQLDYRSVSGAGVREADCSIASCSAIFSIDRDRRTTSQRADYRCHVPVR